jgi:membrane-bound lytic murein transglycosylase D
MTLTTFRSILAGSLLLVSAATNAQISAAPTPTENQGVVDTSSVKIVLPQPATPVVVEQNWLIDPNIVKPRLEALQKEIPLTYNAVTHQFVEYFAFRKPSFTKTMLERKDVYFPLYEKYLKKYGLPDELKYLSLIESGLNPRAMSRVGAGGLWQFMPKTAKIDFGLRIDEYVDERFDPERATESACRYMRQLYNIFGDWHLVLAAYNTGPGNVRRAIRRCNGGQTFWDIYNCLPRETRGYVPQYIGILYMMHHAESHDIVAENYEQRIEHDTIQVNNYLDLDKLASLSNISLENIQKLNPHVLTHILPGFTRNFTLRLPKEELAYFRANRAMIMDSASKLPTGIVGSLQQDVLAETKTSTSEDSTPKTKAIVLASNRTKQELVEDDVEDVVINKKPKKSSYKVKKGDNLFNIADKFNVEVYDLKVWNKLKKSNIQVGQTLVIFKEVAVTSSEKYAKSNRTEKEAVHSGKVKFHKVEQGDTLWNISQRYGGISVEKLKKMNGIKGNVVKAGMKIRVS